MMRYEFSCSSTILSAYPIFLQLANALPRKTVVDSAMVATSNFKRRPCKNARLLRLSLECARVMMEEIPDEQARLLGGHLKQMGKTFSTSFLNILMHITSNGWRNKSQALIASEPQRLQH